MLEPTPQFAARPARETDAAEVVRLACVMFMSMGMDDPGDAWRAVATEQFVQRVGRDAVAMVVDHPTIGARLIASGAATVSTRLPTPNNPTGAYSYIQWVATDDEFRGRGAARAVMTMLLAWLDDRGADIELHATQDGEPLYRSLGFWEGSGAPALRRRSWNPAPGTGDR